LILTAVATLCIAVMLLFEGAAVAPEFKHLLAFLEGGTLDKSELGSGLTMEMLAGVTGIVLGILALLMVAPYTLLSVAIIVYGGGLLLGSGIIARLNAIKIGKSGADDTLSVLAEESAKAGAAFQALIGLAVAILGILAVQGIYTLTLILVAMIAIGGISVLTSSALGGRIYSLLHGKVSGKSTSGSSK